MSVSWCTDGYEPEYLSDQIYPDEIPDVEPEYTSQSIYYHNVPPRRLPKHRPPDLQLLRGGLVFPQPVTQPPLLTLVPLPANEPDVPVEVEVPVIEDETVDEVFLLLRWVSAGQKVCDFIEGRDPNDEIIQELKAQCRSIESINRRVRKVYRSTQNAKEKKALQLLFGFESEE